MKQIAIIIPVYNTEKYLARCLNSVLSQTYDNYEIICVNDGSTDKSLAILNEFAAKHNNIRVITQENRGQSSARNAGLNLVNGKYVLFVDSDDVIPKYALKTFMDVMNKTNADIVVSEGAQGLDNFDESITCKPYGYKLIHSDLLSNFVKNRKIYSVVWNKFYKAEVLKDIRFIEGIYFEDWVFITELFGKIQSFAVIDIPLYMYNQSNISTMRSAFTTHKVDSYMKGIYHIYDIYKDTADYEYAKLRYVIALKICVNKVYKSSKNKAELVAVLKKNIVDLLENKIINIKDLPLKTIFRLFMMKIISFKQILGD